MLSLRGRQPKGVPLPHVRASAPTADPVAATAFFVPGFDAGEPTEREYVRLHACAQRATDAKPADNRIQRVSCRLGGKDCALEVGELHPVDGTTVVAILDLGRQLPYGVFTTADLDEPVLLIRKRVYSVTEFS